MQRSSLFSLTLALALSAAALPALASGSDGAGGAETSDTHTYNLGKQVYAQKLACSGCALSGKSLDAAMARELLAKPPAGLSDEEAKALAVYLARRFKLQ